VKALAPAEYRIIRRHATPAAVQRWIRTLPYNFERRGRTMRSFRGVVRHGTAHCLEAALAAATILERYGYPPLLLDLESQDRLDHVVFAFRHRGRWGAVGASRDQGLFGRRPIYRSPGALARSYYAPYIDLDARIRAYAIVDLRELEGYDWRFSERNVWKVERLLIDYPHRPLETCDAQYRRMRARYRRFLRRHPSTATPFTHARRNWL